MKEVEVGFEKSVLERTASSAYIYELPLKGIEDNKIVQILDNNLSLGKFRYIPISHTYYSFGLIIHFYI